MTVFWRAQISFFMSVATREVVEPGAFPLGHLVKIRKSRFWKWPFGSFWAPEIVSGWVLSCSRMVSMFSGEVRLLALRKKSASSVRWLREKLWFSRKVKRKCHFAENPLKKSGKKNSAPQAKKMMISESKTVFWSRRRPKIVGLRLQNHEF